MLQYVEKLTTLLLIVFSNTALSATPEEFKNLALKMTSPTHLTD